MFLTITKGLSKTVQKLNPKAVWLFFFSAYKSAAYLLIAVVIGTATFGSILTDKETLERGILDWNMPFRYELIFPWIWYVIPLIAVIVYTWARLSYHFYRYELTDNEFKKELGVVFKKYVSIPYNKIQNVDIRRGILERILGLSDLHIQTAGMSGVPATEGRLPGLSVVEAEMVRNKLIQKATQKPG